ncbi:O-antigen ligase [Branchiibius sp. NY16-3462-2]|uniref:O-antigen ligase family protein n=1 Tax=Branchiibius sp. NY16-3462-2 TaxID=1807500 RepID=UPI0007979EED|nr:O-antigen ligase family protein [Branchiibius sp. NY16-3462-2]KYH44492.1 hypothetical protein AZH51_08255 [Branchiibius sp. NY16-3462-2]
MTIALRDSPESATAVASRPESTRLGLTFKVSVAAFLLGVYNFSLLAKTGVPGRVTLTALLVLVLLMGIGPHGPVKAVPGMGYLLALLVGAAGYTMSLLVSGSVLADANGQRFFVTFPLAICAGCVICSSRDAMNYLARSITAVACLSAALAVVEFAIGTSIFGRDAEFASYFRDNSARAVVGAEHPLILGVLLGLAIPFAYACLRAWWLRWPTMLLLMAGIYATGSRGPLGIAVGVVIFMVLPGLARFMARHFGVLFLAALIGLATLWYYASKVWQPVTSSSDALANSMEYRAAIYSLLPRILLARPLGYGLGDLPANVWLIQAPDRAQDITVTVDSQLVLSGMRLGWLGMALLGVILVVAVLAMRRRVDFGLSLFLITGAGTFVALDAWDGAGTLWMMLFGCGLRLLSYPPHGAGIATIAHTHWDRDIGEPPTLDPVASDPSTTVEQRDEYR